MELYSLIHSPLGKITIQANDEGLLGTWFETHAARPGELGIFAPEHPVLKEAEYQLNQYFAGQLTHFDLPVAATGTTFQREVWKVLRDIPFGETLSYQDVANRIGKPKAVRAVGAANGKNPVLIIVPCHRVIGKSGKLTGYAGGVERKEWLLCLEGIVS